MRLCRYFPAYCLMTAMVICLAGLAIADVKADDVFEQIEDRM